VGAREATNPGATLILTLEIPLRAHPQTTDIRLDSGEEFGFSASTSEFNVADHIVQNGREVEWKSYVDVY